MKKYLFCLLAGLSTGVMAQERTSNWKGFERIDFPFQNTQAFLVKPYRAVPGNPWVWRAHFPAWHTEMDSILLSRGFHVAYVNTNDQFGHPKAMQVWDDFYAYLVGDKHLAPKVALEGVSRGGLYVYGWAKRNPDKVSCIYAEAPVCDPKSWPGGKGKSPGSAQDWALWKKLYGLTDEEAATFPDIPLNDLNGLAAFKVPVIHVVSLQDKLVPNDENTFPFLNNYMKAGGPASAYPMSRGAQTLEGHHFPIEHPEQFADFLYDHSVPVAQPLKRQAYIEPNAGLGRSLEKFAATKKGTVAFLGGSITHNPGWRTKVIQYLKERFPETQFTIISAGIPSLGSTPHAFRFQTDVLKKGTPDLLFLESAVNDRVNGFSTDAQKKALEGILRQLYSANPQADAVLMAFADPEKNEDFAKGQTPPEVLIHQELARYYGIPFLNLAREVYDRIHAGEFSWQYDFKDLHPSPFGQEIYFQTMKELLRLPAKAALRTLPALRSPYAYSAGRYRSLTEAIKTKGFERIESWKPTDKTGTREGFVDVPMLVATQAGASFEFPFTGRAVGIAVISGPDAGILSYRIDGGKPRRLDLFTQWSTQLHLPWYLMLGDDLKPGKHTLHVELLPQEDAGRKGNACRIVHFLVNE
ncbi:SGNH/GDSL hydrolase family protein [Siphonobacter aquaeclarae]|uniref:Lysophospholipase L1 n=1 Tax=Siphonobacter aquaeclarae TaxID=563176 RepID=A0A1G9IBI9_9BACT|nr:SGNH/GDSL hydrolase family protein [Siphonobacter aquaeclarae]SDL22482.1 Lysophospholipase L1 [Siphonobacter aquaeclarae]